MTAIKKIISIKNIGKFKNYNANGDVEFKKLTLIYGENGKGKTTLSEIFRSLKENSPNPINIKKTVTSSDNPSVSLLTSEGRTTFNGSWTTPLPSIEIFDSIFVERNIHSGFLISSSQKQNLPNIVFGEKGVELLKEIKALEDEEKGLKDSFTQKVRALTIKHSELPTITDVSSLEKYLETGTIEETQSEILKERTKLEAFKGKKILNETKALEKLSLCNFNYNSFQEFMNKTIENISSEAERKVKQHIEGYHIANSKWIENGLASIEDNRCPFCGQSLLENDLIASYKQYFNDAYKAFKQEAMDYEPQKEVDEAYQNSIKNTINKNSEIRNVWKDYISFSENELTLKHEEVLIRLKEIFNKINELLSEKKENLLETITEKQNEKLKIIFDNFSSVSEIIENYNIQVDTANGKISTYKKTLEGSSSDSIEEAIRKLRIKEICFQEKDDIDKLRQMQNDKEDKTKKIKEKREELKTFSESMTSSYAKEMNSFLCKCGTNFSIALGQPSFRGANPSLDYDLKVEGVSITLKATDIERTRCLGNTLSEGDKTTLAFAFFLAKLKTDEHLSSKIIAIDDPISSLDNFRKQQTVSAIKELLEKTKQMIILSHDFYFLNCFSEVNDRKELEITRSENTSIIKEFSLSEKTQSDQIKQIKKMESYCNGNSADLVDIARQIRPYLEGFLRRLFPKNFSGNQWLGDFIRIIRENADHPLHKDHILRELTDLNDFASRFHHDLCERVLTENVEDNVLRPFVERTLAFNSFIFQDVNQ